MSQMGHPVFQAILKMLYPTVSLEYENWGGIKEIERFKILQAVPTSK